MTNEPFEEGNLNERLEKALSSVGEGHTEEVPEQEAVTAEEQAPKMIKVRFGDEVWEIPEEAELDATTKDGREAIAKLADLKNDFWGKSEVNRRINEVGESSSSVSEYDDLVSQISEKESDLKGFDRIYSILEEMHRLNPELEDDIRDFGARLQKASEFSEKDIENMRLKRDNHKLKKRTTAEEADKATQELAEHIGTQASLWMSDLGVTEEEFQAAAAKLEEAGKIPTVKDAATADQALQAISATFIEEKIVSAIIQLGVPKESEETAIKRAWGLLSADIKMSKEDLTKELGLLLNIQPDTSLRARERVNNRDSRPERRSPKPVQTKTVEEELDFWSRVEKRLGK